MIARLIGGDGEGWGSGDPYVLAKANEGGRAFVFLPLASVDWCLEVKTSAPRRLTINLFLYGSVKLWTKNSSLIVELLANGGDKPKGHYTLTNGVEDHQLGMYDKPLPYFGWGIGWFCLLVGFIFPVMWYFATILYFCNYYQRDPRERAGLAASAIAALICTVAVTIALAVILL